MPSHDLLLHFQEDLQIVQRWVVNGQHYSKTLEAWLKKLDANIKQIWPILETTYGNSLRSEHLQARFLRFYLKLHFLLLTIGKHSSVFFKDKKQLLPLRANIRTVYPTI